MPRYALPGGRGRESRSPSTVISRRRRSPPCCQCSDCFLDVEWCQPHGFDGRARVTRADNFLAHSRHTSRHPASQCAHTGSRSRCDLHRDGNFTAHFTGCMPRTPSSPTACKCSMRAVPRLAVGVACTRIMTPVTYVNTLWFWYVSISICMQEIHVIIFTKNLNCVHVKT